VTDEQAWNLSVPPQDPADSRSQLERFARAVYSAEVPQPLADELIAWATDALKLVRGGEMVTLVARGESDAERGVFRWSFGFGVEPEPIPEPVDVGEGGALEGDEITHDAFESEPGHVKSHRRRGRK